MSATMATTTRLPTIEENPSADVVIYDGDCRFCTSQVERLARWDGSGKRLAFLSLHDPEAAKRYPDLTHDMLMEQMYVVDRRGRRYGGAAAFRYIATQLPRLWPAVPFLYVPFTLPIQQWAYRQVAKRRYKIAGKNSECKNDACELHFGKK